jgi:hypothetical protein
VLAGAPQQQDFTQQDVSIPEQPIHYAAMPEAPPAPSLDDLPF